MTRRLLRYLKRAILLVAVIALTALAVRVIDVMQGPPLQLWHKHAPHELTVKQLDGATWDDYLKAEQAALDDVRVNVTDKLKPAQRQAANRYFDGSPLYTPRFQTDWNRSFVLAPVGTPVGAVVLLHGLTDSPYSLRHIAELYRDRGFVAVGLRVPGHGTVPAGLTTVNWEHWLAATRLAVREAKRLTGDAAPLHLVGYSNGGALALLYALDALEDKALSRPDRLVLFSPMVGVTRFARFAGLAGLPSIFPPFAKTAWLGIVPEFNPFKYNSFPVNAARQSYELTSVLQERITQLAADKRIANLAPVLTFQSIVDFTVSAPAVVSMLYDNLPDNGSELVLFDINRNADLGPLLSSAAETAVERILPAAPRRYRTTVITNVAPDSDPVEARIVEAGQAQEARQPLGVSYPSDIYSLSHVALPFPVDDGLYGTDPDPAEDFGVRLGDIASRGERGTLVVGLDTLMRMSSNPFFAYVADRMAGVIGHVQDRVQPQ
jgi:alpha-beta hydrolase superfamily lysophospholipase